MNTATEATRVLGVAVHAMTAGQALARITAWAQARESRVVCFVNAHSAVLSQQDHTHAASLARADLTLPDGAPVAWMLRRLGHAGQDRVSGPDVMEAILARCAEVALPVFLLGSTPSTQQQLLQALGKRWPGLIVAGQRSPPFGSWPDALNDEIVKAINASGARVVFVGLGCPKQEAWMAQHRERIGAVMLGVGAAFDFHAGTRQRAPRWMRAVWLEWLYRLMQEPVRLGPRYARTNLAFAAAALRQLRNRPHG